MSVLPEGSGSLGIMNYRMVPPVMFVGFYNPHEYDSYICHKP